MTWVAEEFEDVDGLLERLHALCANTNEDMAACRGQADSNWPLEASIDRLQAPDSDYHTRLAEERAILHKFWVRSEKYLGANERDRVEGHLAKNSISAWPVLQHYRAPTRLLDWTRSPYVALYYAAIHRHERDGTVWWFKHKPFEDGVDRRWDLYHMNRDPVTRAVNLSDTAFNPDGPKWISILECAPKFHRIEVQQGFFTVAGRLGLNHAELIEDVMSGAKSGAQSPQYGKIIVRAWLKQPILDRLKTMNIHSRSLDYPGADLVGKELSRELEEARRCASIERKRS